MESYRNIQTKLLNNIKTRWCLNISYSIGKPVKTLFPKVLDCWDLSRLKYNIAHIYIYYILYECVDFHLWLWWSSKDWIHPPDKILKTTAFKALKTSNKGNDSREVCPMIALSLYFDSFQTARGFRRRLEDSEMNWLQLRIYRDWNSQR